MRIQSMFERDITRNINGVIKVTQEDEASIEQELSEYVVTRELRPPLQRLPQRLRIGHRRPHGQDRRVDLGLLRLR